MHHILKSALTLSLAVAFPAAFLYGCAQPGTPPAGDAHDHTALPAGAKPQAAATLRTPDGRDAGRVLLTETAGGVHVQLEATGLTAGAHGFHIHTNGACAPGPNPNTGEIVAFGAAGGHFDPMGTRNHGAPNTSKNHVHAGELPNVTATGGGATTLHHFSRTVTLSPGKGSVMGRTLVVHANADDYRSDPDGNSGGRVLCGVIEPANGGAVVGRTTLEGANVFPEGIAVDPTTGHFFVGSAKEGHLYRFAPGASQAEMFQHGGSPGRQGAYGLKIDDQRKLWVAGGPNGTLAVVDIASASTEATAKVPPGQQAFLNDLAFAGSHAYVTDSYRPVIYRVARNARPLVLETWLDLNSTAIRYKANEINLNGIVASSDGRWLLAIQLVTGQLWRIDTRTKAVTEVRVQGGSLLHGDGLALRGAGELYVLRNEENEIVRVDLSSDWSAGTVSQRVTDPRLKYPSTAVITSAGLQVVNAQLNKQKEPPPLLPFDTVTVALPR